MCIHNNIIYSCNREYYDPDLRCAFSSCDVTTGGTFRAHGRFFQSSSSGFFKCVYVCKFNKSKRKSRVETPIGNFELKRISGYHDTMLELINQFIWNLLNIENIACYKSITRGLISPEPRIFQSHDNIYAISVTESISVIFSIGYLYSNLYTIFWILWWLVLRRDFYGDKNLSLGCPYIGPISKFFELYFDPRADIFKSTQNMILNLLV